MLALFLTGCSSEPGKVFVPGSTFVQSIQLRSAQGERAKVRVGEPLILHAERRTGPWALTNRDGLPSDACWLGAAPPELEQEVADNLKWTAEPPGSARFNVDYRSDHTREVTFSSPGQYRLTAQSKNWCPPPYEGNTLTVEVQAE